MQSETKICQNCKKDFVIEVEDFSFYEKMQVPPPTFCGECRFVRRLIWRNMRSLYKRQCGLCKKNLISFYSDDGCDVYCVECFNGDSWDKYMHARDFNQTRNFLMQVHELFKVQPRIYQFRIGNVVNSDYGNAIVDSKNVYMCFSSIYNEDIMYSENIDRSRNVLDSFSVADLEQCYRNIFSKKNYNSHFMISSNACIDSYFLYDCANSQNCCLSSNLRNQQYVFKNQKLSKEDYYKALEDLKLDTNTGLEKAQQEFDNVYKNAIHKYAQILSSQNATGDFISNSKNISNSFDITDSSEDIKNTYRVINSKQLFDCSFVYTGELAYECVGSSNNTFNQAFSAHCNGCRDMRYSIFCKNSSDCFGCVGLENAKYCILNKQYTKQEYFELVPKIIEHMDVMPYTDTMGRMYRYGEFFPFEFSSFGYNESIALDAFPISKDQALTRGYLWKEKEKKNYDNLISREDLPDNINDVEDSILNQAIACPNNGKQELQCTSAFKIMPTELRFYRDKKLPIPRYCSNCRHYMRLKYRNPMHLREQECMCAASNHGHNSKCENKFQTTYAEGQMEKVYCEKCYQQEVY